MYTKRQVWDAYAASRMDEAIQERGEPAPRVIRDLFVRIDPTGDLTRAKVDQYHRGMAVLERAMLVQSEPVYRDTPEAMKARMGLVEAAGGAAMIEVVGLVDDTVQYVALVERTTTDADRRRSGEIHDGDVATQGAGQGGRSVATGQLVLW
jgi:hypothetical protein